MEAGDERFAMMMDSRGTPTEATITAPDVAEDLAARLAQGPPQRCELNAPRYLYVADVEADATRFRQQASYYARLGLPFPCLRAETPELVPLDALPSMDYMDLMRPPHRYYADSVVAGVRLEAERIFAGSGFSYQEVSPEEARSAFYSAVADFLSVRLNVHRSGLLGRIVMVARGFGKDASVAAATPTWPFEVITSKSNLRVYYSPAYWIKRGPSAFAGSETTPAKGHMPAGTYIFGTMAYGDREVRWDGKSRTSIPPAQRVRLVNA
jgi:hypothetical protein